MIMRDRAAADDTDQPGRTRIMFITTGTDIGGAELMLLKLVTSLDRTRFAPRVVSLSPMGPVGREIQRLGVAGTTMEMKESLTGRIRGVWMLAKEIRRFKPHIVQTWMYHSDLIGGVVARVCSRAKVVWGIRQSNLDPKLSKKSTIMVARICARLSRRVPDLIVCCSNTSATVHAAMGYEKNRMIVVPNGFDSKRFYRDASKRDEVRAQLGLAKGCCLIGNLSRFDPQKDLASFITAARLFQDTRHPSHFVMAGPGIEDSNTEITKLIDQAGLRRNVSLLGELSDVRDVLSALDILTLSSAYGEGFPNIVAEAMLSEVICVVTEVGDAALIVGKYGLIVPIRSPNAICSAWERICQMSTQELSFRRANGRSRVIEEFDLGRVVRAYETSYVKLLEKTPSAA